MVRQNLCDHEQCRLFLLLLVCGLRDISKKVF
jgi:hypothetical protein